MKGQSWRSTAITVRVLKSIQGHAADIERKANFTQYPRLVNSQPEGNLQLWLSIGMAYQRVMLEVQSKKDWQANSEALCEGHGVFEAEYTPKRFQKLPPK